MSEKLLCMQSHIRVLETSQENINALLLGLEYLINISYVDDTEVFKVLFHCLFVMDTLSWKCLIPNVWFHRFAWITGIPWFLNYLKHIII